MVLNTVGLDPLDLLKLICAEFRVSGLQTGFPREATTADYIIALNRFLLERLRDGGNTVLIIDEAQNLTPVVLEQIRLLSNLETDSHKLLQIVLTGQPELRRTLARSDLRQLRQRIAIQHHVEPLKSPDVLPYLRHRIEVAGGCYEQIFPAGVESVFFDFSGGCPRLLNLLADGALLSAYAKKIRPVPQALVERKAEELTASREEERREPARPGNRWLQRKRSNG
jgi:general secretion pathway protein A